MPTNREDAYEITSSRFETEWNAGAPAIVTPAPDIRWDGREKGAIPKGYFCRFSMQWVLERQRTFRNGEDQRYVTAGVLFIQLFGPRNDDEMSAGNVGRLATLARGIFRGKTFDGCVLFRNVRVVDLEPLDNYHRKNVVMEFEYDEIG